MLRGKVIIWMPELAINECSIVISAYSLPNSAISKRFVIYKRRGSALRCSPIPPSGSRIALYRDKQLELAHVVIYDTPHPHILYKCGKSTIYPYVDVSVAYLPVL